MYAAEDFEDIEEVRAKLARWDAAVKHGESCPHEDLPGLAYYNKMRDQLREILKYWEDCAEAAQRVTREHRP